MTFEMFPWGDFKPTGDFRPADDSRAASEAGSADVADHWLDDALRAVTLPEGFLARVSRLADAPPDRSDGRDDNDRSAATRGLSSVTQRREALRRGIQR
jgi:hypothetical protein